MQYKDLLFQPTQFDPVEGIIKGYAAVMGNLDQGRDVIPNGAFLKTIAERGAGRIKIGWQHATDHPLGVTTVIREVGRDQLPADILKAAPDATGGLYVEGKAIKTPTNLERLQLMAEGAVDGLSIGYEAVKEDYKDFKGVHARFLPEIKLYEWSPVTFPMNEAAGVTVVKDQDRALLMKEVEAIVARQLAAAGVKAEEEQPAAAAAAAAKDAETGVAGEEKVGRRQSRDNETHLHAAIGHIAAALGMPEQDGKQPADDEQDDDTTGMTPKSAQLVSTARTLLDSYVKTRLAPVAKARTKPATSSSTEQASVDKAAQVLQLLKELLATEANEFMAGSPDECWGLHCLTEAISNVESFMYGEQSEATRLLMDGKAGEYMAKPAAKPAPADDEDEEEDEEEDDKKRRRKEPPQSSMVGVNVATGTDVPAAPGKAETAAPQRKDREHRLRLLELEAGHRAA